MRSPILTTAALSLLALTLAGCGGGPGGSAAANPDTKYGPHGGLAIPLPGEKGYAEVIAETVPNPKPNAEGVIAVYFLQADLKSPLTPLPTGVTLSIKLPGSEDSKSLTLTPQPKAKDPAGSARVASPVGPYALDRIEGEFSASVDGAAFTKAFVSGR